MVLAVVRSSMFPIALFLAAILAAFSFAPVSASTETAYCFEFRSALYGQCRAYAIKDRARLEWATIKLLVGPPDHSKLLIVNPNNNCFRKQSIAEFLSDKWHYRVITKFDDLKRVGSNQIVKGIVCDRYTYKINDSGFEMWATRKIDATPQLEKAMCTFLAAPSGCGLPVKVLARRKAKAIRNRDGTYSIVKGTEDLTVNWLVVDKLEKVKRDSQDFILPKNYKQAHDDLSLWWSKDGTAKSSDIEDLFTAGEKK